MLKQKTVYFREEDLDKWEAISNKAEFLHNALNQPPDWEKPDSLAADIAVPEMERINKPTKTPNSPIADTKKLVENGTIRFTRQTMEPIPKSFSARKKK